ncbi:hypothetical protein ACLOJK_023700, partial [Asimina triloba]
HKQPPTRFAAVRMEAPVPLWAHHSRADPLIAIGSLVPNYYGDGEDMSLPLNQLTRISE